MGRSRLLLLVLVMTLAGVVTGALVVHAQTPAGSPPRYGPLKLQAFKTTKSPVTTSATTFRRVIELSSVATCRAHLGASATVSMELSGGAASVRVGAGEGPKKTALAPGKVTFDPGGAANSFSFTFHTYFKSPKNAAFDVEWRSLDGTPVTLNKADVQVLHGRKSGDTHGCG